LYNPAHFREERTEVLHGLVREHGLATLVTAGSEGLIATHLPMVLDPEPQPFGTLRGHVAIANSHWREAERSPEALAVFQGPTSYITPSWYPSKQEHGRVVPTYNYIVVHAYGRIRTFRDAARLEAHLRSLTAHHEEQFAERWEIDDAPREYIEGNMKGIVGLEMTITRLEGKWKVSQNRGEADRQGVAHGLRQMADLIDP
jgi:transcriptional regulator